MAFKVYSDFLKNLLFLIILSFLCVQFSAVKNINVVVQSHHYLQNFFIFLNWYSTH